MAWLKNRSKFHNTASSVSSNTSYPDLRPSTAENAQIIAVSCKYIAVGWQSRGGASIAVLKHDQSGKRGYDLPLINANAQPVWDMQFHPYKDDLLYSAGEDSTIHLTRIPEGFSDGVTAESVCSFSGHGKTVSAVRPSLCADGLVASGSSDGTVRLWDVAKAAEVTSTGVGSDVYDASWSHDGGTLLATSKSKKLHVVDPRQKKVASEMAAHEGTKPIKVVWMGDSGRALTTGFTRMRDRELAVWDTRNWGKPLNKASYGSAPGVLTPHFDYDSKLVFLAGRGEATVYCVDMNSDKAPYFENLMTGKHVDKEPQISVALLPKRGLDVMDCEIARMFRVLKDSVQVVHFHNPRRNKEFFQDELYPPTASAFSLTVEQYIGGQTKAPVTKSLEPKN